MNRLKDNGGIFERGPSMIEERSDYFVLAYDSPNFSAAASQVPMTPQGFTKIIKNLERDLGVPLFETDERGVRKPTALADEYYQYAKNLQAARNRLESAFERISNEGVTDLNVACALGIPGLFGADAIRRYSTENPKVNVTFSELPDTLCDSLVRDGFFDVGITIQPAAIGLSTVNLISSPMMLWVNTDDPLSSRDHLTFSDIADRRLAMPGKDFRIYNNFLAGFRKNGFPAPDIVEYAEIFWIYYFALSGKGLGFCLPHIASLDIFIDSDRIKAVPFEEVIWQVCFTWPEGRTLSEHEKKYLESLQKEAKRLKKSGKAQHKQE